MVPRILPILALLFLQRCAAFGVPSRGRTCRRRCRRVVGEATTRLYSVPSIDSVIQPYLPPPDNNNGGGRTGWESPSTSYSLYSPPGAADERPPIVFLGGYVVSNFPTYFYAAFVERLGRETGRKVYCVNYESGNGSGFGNHRGCASFALQVCKEFNLGDRVDVVGHSLGCKIATLMVEEGLQCNRAVCISPNNQDLEGSLEFVVKLIRKLGGTDQISQTTATLRKLLGVLKTFIRFEPDRATFWDILGETWQARKGDLKFVCLEGNNNEDGLDETLEWILEVGQSQGGQVSDQVLLSGAAATPNESSSGAIIVPPPSQDSSAQTIDVETLEYPHLAPCLFDFASSLNEVTRGDVNVPGGKLGNIEAVEDIANVVSSMLR